MTVYVIVDLELHDREHADAFRGYAERAERLVIAAGGRIIAVDPAPRVIEGDWAPRMIVIQEFPDMDAVKRVQRSAAYAPLRNIRQRISSANVIAAAGA